MSDYQKKLEEKVGNNARLALLFTFIEVVLVVLDVACDFQEDYMTLAGYIAIFLSMLFLLRYLIAYKELKDSKVVEKREQQKADEKKIDDFNLSGKDGKWIFPTEEYYQRCLENHITKLTNEFELKKVKAIAEQLIREACPEADLACFQQYLTDENLQKYMQIGKPQAEQTARKKLEESKKVRTAKATPEEEKYLRRADALSVKTGCDKRITMLNNLLTDCDQRIYQLRAGEEAMIKLAGIYAGQQKKEKNWASIGGFAEGLAGPAAGIMAATDAMRDNNEIRKYNEGMRQLSMDIMKGTFESSTDRYKLEREKEKIQQKIEETKEKISLTRPSAQEIWDNFGVNRIRVSKNKSGVLKCSVDLHQRDVFHLDVPKEVNMVVDGTIKGDIWTGETYVGAVNFPLPLYGIPCNTSSMVTLDGMCESSMEYDGSYSLKLRSAQNLWIMEA